MRKLFTRWLARIPIQTTLFLLIGIAIFLSMGALAYNMWNLIKMQQIGATQVYAFDRMQATTMTSRYLGYIELTEDYYFTRSQREYLALQRLHSHNVDEFLREAVFWVETENEKMALANAQQAKEEYDQAYEAAVNEQETLAAQNEAPPWQIVFTYDPNNPELGYHVAESILYRVAHQVDLLHQEAIVRLEEITRQADWTMITVLSVGVTLELLFIFFAVGAGWAIVNKLMIPVTDLSRELHELFETQDYDMSPLQTLADRRDEIGELADAVIDMSKTAERRHEEKRAEIRNLQAKLDRLLGKE